MQQLNCRLGRSQAREQSSADSRWTIQSLQCVGETFGVDNPWPLVNGYQGGTQTLTKRLLLPPRGLQTLTITSQTLTTRTHGNPRAAGRRPITALPGCPPPWAAPSDVPGAKGSPICRYFPGLGPLKRTFPKQNPYQTLRISSKHLRQTLRFGPKHLPNTPQKVLRSTLDSPRV